MREVGDGGGRLLTSSEDDGSFGSLSGYDFNDDGLQGGRKEVSMAAEESECDGRWHDEWRRRGDLRGRKERAEAVGSGDDGTGKEFRSGRDAYPSRKAAVT
jgi:hypothetical protein